MSAMQHLTLDITNAYYPHGYYHMAFDTDLLIPPRNQLQKWFRPVNIVEAQEEQEALDVEQHVWWHACIAVCVGVSI